MDLIFTGRGAAFNVLEGNTNAYILEDGKLFLVDCGELVFATIQKKGLLEHVKEIYVVVSHMHGDHCGSLGSFSLFCKFVLGLKLKIVVPHNELYLQQLQTLMSLFGNTKQTYEFIYEEELDGAFKAFNSVRYELTQHEPLLLCHSFVFETDQDGVFYSADTHSIENMLEFINKHPIIDKIYTEFTDLNTPEDIHLNIELINTSISSEIKEKVYLMHFRNSDCLQKALDLGFKVVSC